MKNHTLNIIIDEWVSDYGIEYSGTINMIANKKHKIKPEYFEDVGGAGCKLEWINYKQSREVVPKSQLFPMYISGLEDNYFGKTIIIYPNPIINKQMYIQLEDNNAENEVTIYHLVGKPVFKTIIEHSYDINLNDIPTGIYIVSIKNKSISINKRTLIQ